MQYAHNMETLEKFIALRNFINATERRSLVYGASFSEFLIFKAIAAQGKAGIRRIDLADEVGLSVSGVTRALMPLEKSGYVEKLDEALDARVRRVGLTRAGKELFKDIEKNVQQNMLLIEVDLEALLKSVRR